MKPALQPAMPGNGPTAWDNYPRTLLVPLPPQTSLQVVSGITEPDTLRQTPEPRTVPLYANADDGGEMPARMR